MLYATVRIKLGVFTLGIFHKSWQLTVFNRRLGPRRCSVKELNFVYVEDGAFVTQSNATCEKAIDGRGSLWGWGSSANWQADGSSGQVVCTLLFACLTAWHGVIGEQLARGYAKEIWCRPYVVIIAERHCSLECLWLYANRTA